MRLSTLENFTICGRGATGLVFEGFHEGRSIAVKTISADQFSDARVSLFFREAHALQRMNHPNIVEVLGYGVFEEGFSADETEIPAGSAYIVMERASGELTSGDIDSWAELQQVVNCVLSGLGHAHARGIVHRDLKPANVLVDLPTAPFAITDFGIAQVFAENVDPTATADVHAPSGGTPGYMAPEQMHGYWRTFGPWTDFYAAGAMFYEITFGRLPHARNSPLEIAVSALTEPLNLDLTPRFAVPEAYLLWLKKLLAPEFYNRFEYASDALQHFATIASSTNRMAKMREVNDTVAIQETESAMTMVDTIVGLDESTVSGLRSWFPERRDEAAEFDILQTIQSDNAHLFISAPRGYGKSRLLRTAYACAHERGHTVVPIFQMEGGERDGLRGVPRFLFMAYGVNARNLRALAEERLRFGEPASETLLDEIVSLAFEGSHAAPVRIEHPKQRYGFLTRLVAALRRERRLTILIDNLHLRVDALAWVTDFQESHPDVPIRLIGTYDSDAELSEPVEHYFETWEVRENTIAVEPMTLNDIEAIETFVGTELMAKDIFRKTEGHPAFVRHTVLAKQLFDSLDACLTSRIETYVKTARHPEILGIASLIGSDIPFDLWERAASAMGIVDVQIEINRLVAAQFVRVENAYAMFDTREIATAARVWFRDTEYFEKASRTLADLLSQSAEDCEMRAHLLLNIGDVEGAISATNAAVDSFKHRSDYGAILRCVDSVPNRNSHDGATRLRLKRIEARRFRGDADLYPEIIEELKDLERDDLVALAHRIAGGISMVTGRVPEAWSHYSDAIAAYDRVGDAEGQSGARDGLGWLGVNAGMFVEAETAFFEALEFDVPFNNAWACSGLSDLFNRTKRHEEALERAEKGIELGRSVSSRAAVGMGMLNRSNALRNLKRYKEAEEGLINAIHDMSEIRIPLTTVGHLYYMALLVELRRPSEALVVAQKMTGLNVPAFIEDLASLITLVAAVESGDKQAAKFYYDRAKELWNPWTAIVEPNIVLLMARLIGTEYEAFGLSVIADLERRVPKT